MPLVFLPMLFLSFLFEIVDASFGGGYGTLLTPVLLLLGYDPAEAVPAVLFSQLTGDFLAVFFHHEFKNVDLSFRSEAFRIAVSLSLLSALGSIIGVTVAINLTSFLLNLYIGALITAIGLIILVYKNRKFVFSWPRLISLGFLAAFNKGISGGGYGPLIAGGQILTGVKVKSAVGITSLAEGIICIIAVLSYFLAGKTFDWSLTIILSIGAMLSAPVSAYIIRKIQNKRLKLILAITTLLLGLTTILQTIFY